MANLRSDASWLFAFLLALTAPIAAASMTYPDLPAPEKGSFDWTQFHGKYDFSDCRSRSSAIWGDALPGTFIQIDQRDEGLELMRANNRNPVALGWSLERVGQGRQSRNDGATDKGLVTESYATADGVYGMMAWDRPHNVGWSTLQLRMTAEGNISLTLRQRTDSDAATREETCTLTRYAPKFRA
jgi:hypothetical protein